MPMVPATVRKEQTHGPPDLDSDLAASSPSRVPRPAADPRRPRRSIDHFLSAVRSPWSDDGRRRTIEVSAKGDEPGFIRVDGPKTC